MIGLLGAAALIVSCARPRVAPPQYTETGTASWYGPGFQGKQTSNREIYDMNDMTAAHRTLPFGTHVMVINLENGRSAVVRINDRGPFIKGRIIDLSQAAARMLDMIEPGTARVRLEVLHDISPDPGSVRYVLQVGSFTVRSNAEALRKQLAEKYRDVHIVPFATAGGTYFRVRIRAGNHADAQRLARLLREDGHAVLLLEEK